MPLLSLSVTALNATARLQFAIYNRNARIQIAGGNVQIISQRAEHPHASTASVFFGAYGERVREMQQNLVPLLFT